MAKFQVCPDCEGEGTVDNFGAFTTENLDEWYGDSIERDEFMEDYMAGRIGRKICSYCNGNRVVTEEQIDSYQDELDYRAEVEAEMRMGA